VPPVAQPPRSGLARWLDRHAHPESRTFRYLDLARALIQVLAVAGLLGLVVQLREANITAKRDAYNRSVDAALLVERLELDNPDLACALLPEGPERRLEVSEMRDMRYLEMNLDLHERLWQQHQEGIFDDEEWEPWQRWFREGVVTGEMFPAVWAWDRDYYQQDFARYVDAVVSDEVTRRETATMMAGGTPSPPRSLADYADTPPEEPLAC
jgi:hypothetical protein